MLTFQNLDSLKNFLRADKGTNSLNAVRLINVNSISMWLEMKKFLATLSEKFICVSDFCNEDTTPKLIKLYSELKKINQSVCVIPLSEYLRLQPESAADELNKILNIQAQGTKKYRIYFLMYRLQSLFQSAKIAGPRKKDCVILLDTESADDYSLTIVQKNMALNLANTRVDGFKNYLKYWEETPQNSLSFFTDKAIYFQDKNFFDDVKIIVNAFNLLRHYYNLPEILEKKFGTDEQWENLARLASEKGDVAKVFQAEFSTADFQTKLLARWNEQNNFRRWLLWIFCKVQNFNSYAVSCAQISNSPEEFIEKIFLSIFDFVKSENFDAIYGERKEILSLLKIPAPPIFVEKILSTDKKIALKVLTATSMQEKVLIFETLQKFNPSEYDAALKILQKIYPDLSNYLSNSFDGFNAELKNYFREYRRLKVADTLTADFFSQVQEISARKGRDIYALKSRNQIVEEEYTEGAAVFFVDALGAEYLNYFYKNFAPLKENFSIRYQFGYCNLPSITERNKDFLQGKNIVAEILELDKLKHSNLNYPENIIEELDFLATLQEKILIALNSYRKIILCADHGSSRLAVIARKTNFDKSFNDDGREIFNNGRYSSALRDDEKIFDTAVVDDNKIIFADYSRFLQKGAPGNELHGGATFEEWLVPVITLEKVENISPRPKKKSGIAKNEKFDI